MKLIGEKVFGMGEMECPICETEIRSDADALKNCALCGMSIELSSPIHIKRKNKKFNFCSEICKSKFLKVGFRSFNLY